jgi:hypothetical protein
MARPLFNRPFKEPFKSTAAIAPLIAVLTFVAIGLLHWPLPLVLLVIVPASVAAAYLNPGMRR